MAEAAAGLELFAAELAESGAVSGIVVLWGLVEVWERPAAWMELRACAQAAQAQRKPAGGCRRPGRVARQRAVSLRACASRQGPWEVSSLGRRRGYVNAT